MKLQNTGWTILGLFILFSVYCVAINILWGLGIKDIALLGIISLPIFMATLYMLNRSIS